jgi:ATP-dependent Clp endopeptidase proteolytic subunit ClpP
MAVDLKPTEAMASEASLGLQWRREFNRGGTEVGVARARDISNRTNLSEETVRRMVSYFARHEVDKQGEGFSPGEDGYPSAGRIAWALWGGDPGQSWANAKARQLDNERNNEMEIHIENRAGKVKLNSGVYKESADKLIDDLDKLYGPAAVVAQMCIGEVVCSADDALESVEVEINSPGGSVFEGQRIFNALRSMSARGVEVTATVNGLAASMGSVILMAGDKRRMTAGSRIMIHEASTIAVGDSRSLRKQSDLLEGISAEIAGIYAERTGGDEKEIRKMMYAETWMTAEEAKANGFVDVILKDGKEKEEEEFDKPTNGMTGILAKLFPGNDEAAKIEAAILENDTLRAELEKATQKVDELTGLVEVNAQLQSDLAAAQSAVAEFETKAIADSETIKELEEATEVSEEKVSAKASELLASTGHPSPVALAADNNEAPPSHLAVMAKLSPTDAAEYFAAHKAEILADNNRYKI